MVFIRSRNFRLKWELVLNPQSTATFATGKSDVLRSEQASAQRKSLT